MAQRFRSKVRKVQTQLVVCSNLNLPTSQHQQWFDILLNDDVISANLLLKTATDNVTTMLLTCTFDFGETKGFGTEEAIMEKINRPFHLAIGCCSKKVAELMLKYNVDVLVVNKEGNNVLHSAVIAAFNKPFIEDELCQTLTWLYSRIDPESVKKLLMHENKAGLRPVEFASQQGCLKLMMNFFHAAGHVTSEKVLGIGIYRHHDVTDYEIGERNNMSPVNMLAYLHEKKLQDPATAEIILSPLVSKWIDKKIKSNVPWIVAWGLYRLLFISLFIVLDLDITWLEAAEGNETNFQTVILTCHNIPHFHLGATVNYLMAGIILLQCSVTFISMIRSFVCLVRGDWEHKICDLRGRKSLINNALFYNALHTLLVLIIFITTIVNIHIMVNHMQESKAAFLLMDIARSFIPVLALWSVCFFLQLSATIGSSIINIQGMLIDMSKFMILFAVVLIPFVHAFESFSLANAKETCNPDFENFIISGYTLFRMMLNLYDPSGLDLRNRVVMLMLHVIYVFMIGILLINFLIAMMSKRATNSIENEKAVLKINQLALVDMIEDQLFAFKPLGKYSYIILRKLSFCCNKGKVYVKSCQDRFEELNNMQKRGGGGAVDLDWWSAAETDLRPRGHSITSTVTGYANGKVMN